MTPSISSTSPFNFKPRVETVQLPLEERLFLGQRVRDFRSKKGQTCLELAEDVLGYDGSHAFMSRLERGVLRSISKPHLEALAQHFGLAVEVLLQAPEEVVPQDENVSAAVYRQEDVLPGANNRMRELRQAAGLTMVQMAEKLGHSIGSGATQIRTWEQGKEPIRPDTLLKVAAAFGVSGSWLIRGARVRPKRPTGALRTRGLRIARGLSRSQLAFATDVAEVGLVRSDISRMEAGIYPSPERIEQVARALDVPPQWLVPEKQVDLQVHTGAASHPLAEQLWSDEQSLSVPQRKQLSMWRAMMATGQLDGEVMRDVSRFIAKKVWARKKQG